jgi:hypothetical protein
MNDFVDAIKNNSKEQKDDGKSNDPSSQRYDELKKEEADVETSTPAEKRYQEIKDKAKREMIEKEKESESQEEESEDKDQGFVTY